MANFTLDNSIEEIQFNGQSVDKVYFNALLVWEKSTTPIPPIPTAGGLYPTVIRYASQPIESDIQCLTQYVPEILYSSVYVANMYVQNSMNNNYSDSAICSEYWDALLDAELNYYGAEYTAIAEAKLLETGLVIPLQTNGGYLSAGRVDTKCSLVTNELLKSEDIVALDNIFKDKTNWYEYHSAAVSYLNEKGYTLKDEVNLLFNRNLVISNWDVLLAEDCASLEILKLLGDTLVGTYKGNGQLTDYTPRLAESWENSGGDGTSWIFNLRQGVEWVDYQGRSLGEMTAYDFVAGIQHALDGCSMYACRYIVPYIQNAMQYMMGEIEDFSQVGVSALDDYTLQLDFGIGISEEDLLSLVKQPCYMPLNQDYYSSKGGSFGSNPLNQPGNTYGSSFSDILYIGKYIVTNATEKYAINLLQNSSYWEGQEDYRRSFSTIVFKYYEGSNFTDSNLLDGTIDFMALSDLATDIASPDFEGCIYAANAGQANLSLVLNADSSDYLKSHNFRKLLLNTFNKFNFFTYYYDYFPSSIITDAKNATKLTLRNMVTNDANKKIGYSGTVKINNTDVSFSADTTYGQIVQLQLNADGAAGPSSGIGDVTDKGFDGYNIWLDDAAYQTLKDAVFEEFPELSTTGVTLTFACTASRENDSIIQQYDSWMLPIFNALLESINVQFTGVGSDASSANVWLCDFVPILTVDYWKE